MPPWVHHPPTLPGMVNVPVDTLSAVLEPWAQGGGNPWVRGLIPAQNLKSVMRVIPLRIELSALPGEKVGKIG